MTCIHHQKIAKRLDVLMLEVQLHLQDVHVTFDFIHLCSSLTTFSIDKPGHRLACPRPRGSNSSLKCPLLLNVISEKKSNTSFWFHESISYAFGPPPKTSQLPIRAHQGIQLSEASKNRVELNGLRPSKEVRYTPGKNQHPTFSWIYHVFTVVSHHVPIIFPGTWKATRLCALDQLLMFGHLFLTGNYEDQVNLAELQYFVGRWVDLLISKLT